MGVWTYCWDRKLDSKVQLLGGNLRVSQEARRLKGSTQASPGFPRLQTLGHSAARFPHDNQMNGQWGHTATTDPAFISV